MKPETTSRHAVVNLVHARDIKTIDFLAGIRYGQSAGLPYSNRWHVAEYLETKGYRAAGTWGGDEQVKVPQRLVLAKARRLLKQGLIDGCACGCRGDFELRA